MARAKSTKNGAANVTKKRPRLPKDVAEYASRLPEAARQRFTELRAIIRSAVPAGATETISYGIPAFTLDGVLVWFAVFAKHSSLFPTASVIAAFSDELKDCPVSKGTVKFPHDRPLPKAVIKKMVKLRVKQHKADE